MWVPLEAEITWSCANTWTVMYNRTTGIRCERCFGITNKQDGKERYVPMYKDVMAGSGNPASEGKCTGNTMHFRRRVVS